MVTKAKKKKKVTKKIPVKKKDLTIADGIPVHCSCDAILEISKVKPYGMNANKHPEKQVLLLAKLISGHGWRGPITISKQSGFVVRGHGRLAAATELGVSFVPVDYQNYTSDEMEKADRIADNKIQELSGWDKSLLKEEIIHLDSGILADVDLTGFDAPDLEGLLTAAPPDCNNKKGTDDISKTIGKCFILELQVDSKDEQRVLFDEMRDRGIECRISKL